MTMTPAPDSPIEPRRFTREQRYALWLASDGRCAACGCDLEPGWHADHWEPYSRGGATDTDNGQALCPRCNLKKGAKMARPMLPWTLKLLDWQAAALDVYERLNRSTFTLIACPAAGKTIWGGAVIHRWILARENRKDGGPIPFVVVVVPSDTLRKQWQTEMAELGIDLWDVWLPDTPLGPPGFHGVCVTYHQVARHPGKFADLCRRRDVLVLADEIHHAGHDLTWGNSFYMAFVSAAQRVLMSGTLFREDENKIPFINYLDGKSVADHVYGYAEALTDGVCRSILFPHIEGVMHWKDRVAGRREAQFADKLSQEDQRRRLNTAIDADGDYIRHQIFEANAVLDDIRGDFKKGAAMLVARDQRHAERLAPIVEEITGETPLLVISDDPESSKKIQAFKESTQRWIISVKKVSEGVNIPRLVVGVFATNVLTELFFRQVIGRFQRVVKGYESLVAVFFLPREAVLVAYAEAVMKERDHAIDEIERDALDMFEEYEERKEAARGDGPSWTPESSRATDTGFVYAGEFYGDAETREARRYCADLGQNSPEFLAFAIRFARKMRAAGERSAPAPAAASSDPSEHIAGTMRRESQKAIILRLKRAGTAKVGPLGYALASMMGPNTDAGRIIKAINTKIIRRFNCAVDKMGEAELKERARLLGEWTEMARDRALSGMGGGWIESWLMD